MTWVALAVIVVIAFWPCRKGSWEEFGDGYLYVYSRDGQQVGEVYTESGKWVARVYGKSAQGFATVGAAMTHVEVESA